MIDNETFGQEAKNYYRLISNKNPPDLGATLEMLQRNKCSKGEVSRAFEKMSKDESPPRNLFARLFKSIQQERADNNEFNEKRSKETFNGPITSALAAKYFECVTKVMDLQKEQYTRAKEIHERLLSENSYFYKQWNYISDTGGEDKRYLELINEFHTKLFPEVAGANSLQTFLQGVPE